MKNDNFFGIGTKQVAQVNLKSSPIQSIMWSFDATHDIFVDHLPWAKFKKSDVGNEETGLICFMWAQNE